ncbi:MAG: DUF1778 domain-containing protein [Alphaproteobacteria bacterium]|nr:DUF1778 domain-containing protein [Alphaproteobacteria bacterium]
MKKKAITMRNPRNRATDRTLDQRVFTLDAAQHAQFLKALDEPALQNEKLKRLMASRSPWGK